MTDPAPAAPEEKTDDNSNDHPDNPSDDHLDNSDDDHPDNSDDDHLHGLEDGAGCTEIWEHLSEQRDGEDE